VITRLLESTWRFRLLLIVQATVIIGMPIIAEATSIDTTPIGLTIIVIGVIAASGRSGCRSVLMPAAVALPLVWICSASPDTVLSGFNFLVVAGLLFLSTSITLGYLKERQEVDEETLAAAAAGYLLFGLACGALYATLSVWFPGGLEFTGLPHAPNLHDHVYFSFVVLTTIGFGDVVPQDAVNRSLAMLEGIIGLFYFAFVISRLVSLYRLSRTP